jgi:hypothetical protein
MIALRRALERCTFDGTECHGVVDAELRGLELELAASAIKHSVLSQFRGCVPLDYAIEVVLALLDNGELA